MIRITKKGELPTEKIHRGKCVYCHTEFEFTKDEAGYESGARNENFLIVPCPLCKKEVWTEVP